MNLFSLSSLPNRDLQLKTIDPLIQSRKGATPQRMLIKARENLIAGNEIREGFLKRPEPFSHRTVL